MVQECHAQSAVGDNTCLILTNHITLGATAADCVFRREHIFDARPINGFTGLLQIGG